ncbi:hypothetical protein FAES_3383 [Fibrella aestuarina BUZ 2]|uniref:Uncharacterized protein n=1 Tax=Fibrella aestuarina BUZ 2 TaxID=1166018 RepID=I0KB88_9BACT|nr:hypothetical protein FAES_3383 [Fibrella aestuarina BUZ 2]
MAGRVAVNGLLLAGTLVHQIALRLTGLTASPAPVTNARHQSSRRTGFRVGQAGRGLIGFLLKYLKHHLQ